jgi:hypothetical protein
MTYVALDFGKEMQLNKDTPLEKTWELPDGNVILVGDEAFRYHNQIYHFIVLFCFYLTQHI